MSQPLCKNNSMASSRAIVLRHALPSCCPYFAVAAAHPHTSCSQSCCSIVCSTASKLHQSSRSDVQALRAAVPQEQLGRSRLHRLSALKASLKGRLHRLSGHHSHTLAGALPNGSPAAAAEGVGQAKGGEHQNVGSPKATALQEGAAADGQPQETGAIQVNACQTSCEQHVH